RKKAVLPDGVLHAAVYSPECFVYCRPKKSCGLILIHLQRDDGGPATQHWDQPAEIEPLPRVRADRVVSCSREWGRLRLRIRGAGCCRSRQSPATEFAVSCFSIPPIYDDSLRT